MDALKHYKSNAGGEVPANQKLINDMQKESSFQKVFGPKGDVTNGIREKIKKALQNGTKRVQNAPGSHRALWIFTLGNYSVNIEYDHSVSSGENHVSIHLYGKDLWDFETSDNHSAWENFIEETVPGWIAGKGTPFYVTYDFHINIIINV